MSRLRILLPNDAIVSELTLSTGGLTRWIEGSCRTDFHEIEKVVFSEMNISNAEERRRLGSELKPLYWCLPAILGNDFHIPREIVLNDTIRYSRLCIIRDLIMDRPEVIKQNAQDDIGLISRAYDQARIELEPGKSGHVQAFISKCEPWWVVVREGTTNIMEHVLRQDRHRFNQAIEGLYALKSVFGCLQLVDDASDEEEDSARGLWNIWNYCEGECVKRLGLVMVADSIKQLEFLDDSVLRMLLAIQLRDTLIELSRVFSAR